MLDYYIGTEAEIPQFAEYPQITGQNMKKQYIKRYSSTQNSHMTLQGIIGSVTFDMIPEQCLDYLIAGEVTHIGKIPALDLENILSGETNKPSMHNIINLRESALK